MYNLYANANVALIKLGINKIHILSCKPWITTDMNEIQFDK